MAETGRLWRLPRECDVYWSEFIHCKSFRHRLHNYYTYGTTPDCQEWKADYESCREWERTHSPDAKERIQTSERKRVKAQKNFTPVWEMRQSPPSDWHQPLDQDS